MSQFALDMTATASHHTTMSHESRAWYVLPLSDGTTSAMTLDAIEAAFARLYPAQTTPTHAAIFRRFDSSHSLHCEVTLFFSPEAASLAAQFDALPCEPPALAGLELLAGKQSSLQVLFRRSEKKQ